MLELHWILPSPFSVPHCFSHGYCFLITAAAENPASQRYAIKENVVQCNFEAELPQAVVVCSVTGRPQVVTGASLKN